MCAKWSPAIWWKQASCHHRNLWKFRCSENQFLDTKKVASIWTPKTPKPEYSGHPHIQQLLLQVDEGLREQDPMQSICLVMTYGDCKPDRLRVRVVPQDVVI